MTEERVEYRVPPLPDRKDDMSSLINGLLDLTPDSFPNHSDLLARAALLYRLLVDVEAAQEHFEAAQEQVRQAAEMQWNLPPDQAYLLVRGVREQDKPMMPFLQQMARNMGVPLTGLVWIRPKRMVEGQKPMLYITFEGLWASLYINAQHAPVLFLSEIVRFPQGTREDRVLIAQAVLIFADGTIFNEYGATVYTPSLQDPENAVLRALTKARRRTLRTAIAVGVPEFGEAVGWQEEAAEARGLMPPLASRALVPEEGVPRNLADLLRMAKESFGLGVEEVTELLQVDPSAIAADVSGSWHTLVERAMAKGGNAESETKGERGTE